MHVEITIKVKYDESSVTNKRALLYALDDEFERVISHGALSPSGEEIVDESEIRIKASGV